MSATAAPPRRLPAPGPHPPTPVSVAEVIDALSRYAKVQREVEGLVRRSAEARDLLHQLDSYTWTFIAIQGHMCGLGAERLARLLANATTPGTSAAAAGRRP
jgi:hypothetical protein